MSDGLLSAAEYGRASAHVDECPVCRQAYAETREIRQALARIARPNIPAGVQHALKRAVRSELDHARDAWLPFSLDVRDALRSRVMPYAVGVMASIIVGFTFLTLMFSSFRIGGPLSPTKGDYVSDGLFAGQRDNGVYSDMNLSPALYAQSRMPVNGESPSVNPQGALVALTRSLVRGNIKDAEVVVIADVFGNGLAQISEVIEPSKDRRAVTELQKALATDPAYAPFVPANMDNRSDSVRVILRLQRVNVTTHAGRH
ncbi:MAG: hypothetical protein JO053_09135 [Acidobacteria bacterium]|nr:hypothetical protein [Acidobacteriota bacterium]